MERKSCFGEAIFRSPVAPTDIVVWNDNEAIKLMWHLNRLGLRVPDDVSIATIYAKAN